MPSRAHALSTASAREATPAPRASGSTQYATFATPSSKSRRRSAIRPSTSPPPPSRATAQWQPFSRSQS